MTPVKPTRTAEAVEDAQSALDNSYEGTAFDFDWGW